MKCPYPMPLRLRLKLAWLVFRGHSFSLIVGFMAGEEIDPNRLCDTRRWSAGGGKAPACGNKAVVTMAPCSALLDYYAGGVWHLCADCADAAREHARAKQKACVMDDC